MKKTKLSVIILATVMMSLPISSFGYENINENGVNIEIETRDFTVKKTVTVKYSRVGDIPDSIYYEEYNATIGRPVGGTLYYKSHIISSGKYVATFSGTLYAGLRKAE